MLSRLFFFVMIFTICVTISGCQNNPSGYSTITPQSTENKGLALLLSLDRTEYRVGETAWVTIKIKNVSEEPILVFKCFWPYEILNFETLNSKGENIAPVVSVQYICWAGPYAYVGLDPDQAIEQAVVVQGLNSAKKPGKYTVQVRYKNQHGGPNPDFFTDPKYAEDAWKGELYSNIVTVTVKP
jgi:hypothetical protein